MNKNSIIYILAGTPLATFLFAYQMIVYGKMTVGVLGLQIGLLCIQILFMVLAIRGIRKYGKGSEIHD